MRIAATAERVTAMRLYCCVVAAAACGLSMLTARKKSATTLASRTTQPIVTL